MGNRVPRVEVEQNGRDGTDGTAGRRSLFLDYCGGKLVKGTWCEAHDRSERHCCTFVTDHQGSSMFLRHRLAIFE